MGSLDFDFAWIPHIFTTQNFRIIRDKPGTIKRGWTIEHVGKMNILGTIKQAGDKQTMCGLCWVEPQGSRKLAPLAPPVPDKPHLVGQNEI